MNRLRSRLSDPDRAHGGPRAAEYAIILVVFGIIALGALLITATQTTMIYSTVSGSV